MKEIDSDQIMLISGACPPCGVVAVISLLETAATYAGAGVALYGAYKYFTR